MKAFLEQYPMEDFARILKKGLSESDDFSSMAGLFVELLDAVTSFEGFHVFMKRDPEGDGGGEGKEGDGGGGDDGGWDMPAAEEKEGGQEEEEKDSHK